MSITIGDDLLAKWKSYFAFKDAQNSTTKSADMSGLARKTALDFENGKSTSTGHEAARLLGRVDSMGRPLRKSVSQDAARALHDFGFFRRRYLGRAEVPWQIEDAEMMVTYLDDADRTYVVVNMPPGAGKSTWMRDFCCWLIARDRSVRILFGSRTEPQARKNADAVRKVLEATRPIRGRATDVERGMAFDADAAMSVDFGPFKPENPAVWSAGRFTVEQEGAQVSADTESTIQSYGIDSGFLGDRCEVVIWDDLVDKTNILTVESREALLHTWTTEAETRVEPGGLFILVGQRMAPDDLYHDCLERVNEETGEKIYRHLKRPAHDESVCTVEPGMAHPNVTEPWPKGCLLDPDRLTWRDLMHKKSSTLGSSVFNIQYQQNDGDPNSALVKHEWLYGGRSEGIDYPGCVDRDRDLGNVPVGLRGNGWSVVTLDPSPTKYWGIHWIGYHPATELRYLLNTHRAKMKWPEVFHYDFETGEYGGLLESWWQASNDAGFPISTVIFEQNAAQRFMLQDAALTRWCALRKVNLVAHDTHRANKADPQYGVQAMAEQFRFARVRIPYAESSRALVKTFLSELERYGQGTTDDTVMSWWFFEYNLPRIFTPIKRQPPRRAVPGFVSAGARRGFG